MLSYTTVNGKQYRNGYTTGSCAAAAAKASVYMLFRGEIVNTVEIDTPAGIKLNLVINDAVINTETAICSITKDGGDDPDVTTGLKIFAEAKRSSVKGISIKTSNGIGVVTLPGLKVLPGQPAINPVPMKMIIDEVNKVLPKDEGVEVVFSIPGGEEVAKRTYNPKLGIIGGISILGTTGIVSPMSEEAWKESLALELSIMGAKGIKKAVFTFGNYGEDFAVQKLGVESCYIITISNFVGYMLDEAVENKIEEIVLVGHLGKLIKVAAGIFHTHSRVADARMEIMAAYAALEGASKEIASKIYDCRTTDAAAEIINTNQLCNVYHRIVGNVSKRCREYTFEKIKIGCVLFSSDNVLLAEDEAAKEILKGLQVTNSKS